jgi:cytochrome b
MTETNASASVRVWDLPTRAFHWLLAAAVVGLVITGHVGGNAVVWHMRLGLFVLVLLGFRLVWGVVGGRWSRWASFLYSPGTVLRYLRGNHRPGDHFEVGHSPTGAGSVLALIAVLAVQVGTGLVADDEIATTGPLNKFVSSATGLQATSWHKDWGQWLLIALVVLHIAAIVVYRLRGNNLVTPMVTGDKALPPDVPASQDRWWPNRALALAVLAVCFYAVSWIAKQGG